MPELVDLEEYQRERDRIIAEFDAKVAQIQSQIDSLNIEIAIVEGQVSYWGGEVDKAQVRINSLRKEIEDLGRESSTWQDRISVAGNLEYGMSLQTGENEFYENRDIVLPYYNNCVAVWENSGVSFYWQSEGGRLFKLGLKFPGEADYIYGYYGKKTYETDIPISALFQRLIGYAINKVNLLENQRSTKQSDLYSAQTDLFNAQFQLSAAQNDLESKTRHMRDLQLAMEAAEEEKRGALALWEAEYQAALERKRIEIGSIGRDLELGYPAMDAETARNIAEMAYAEALARGFTRLADAIRIAGDLADEWADKPVIPHYTTKTIFCPTCGIKLEITSSDIEADNRDLSCPECGASVGKGIQVRIFEPVVTYTCPYCGAIFSSQAELNAHIAEAHPGFPIAGAWDWIKKYAPWIAVAGAGAVTLYVATKKK